MSGKYSNLSPETRELMRQRYGKGSDEKGSRTWKIAALTISIFFIPWLIWSAWHHSNPEIRTTLISFQNESEKSIDITFLVERRNPSTPLTCTLIARDIDKNIAGEIQKLIPAGNSRSQSFTVTIPTRVTPVNAAVLGCRAA